MKLQEFFEQHPEFFNDGTIRKSYEIRLRDVSKEIIDQFFTCEDFNLTDTYENIGKHNNLNEEFPYIIYEEIINGEEVTIAPKTANVNWNTYKFTDFKEKKFVHLAFTGTIIYYPENSLKSEYLDKQICGQILEQNSDPFVTINVYEPLTIRLNEQEIIYLKNEVARLNKAVENYKLILETAGIPIQLKLFPELIHYTEFNKQADSWNFPTVKLFGGVKE